MRDRHPMTRPQPAEIVSFHGSGKALANAGSNDIDKLAGEKMRRSDLGTDLQQAVPGDAELGEARLRFDLCLREMPPLRLRDILGLGASDPQLHRRVAV